MQALALCSLRALNGEGSVAHSALSFLYVGGYTAKLNPNPDPNPTPNPNPNPNRYRERGIMRCIMHFIIEPLDACPRVAELGKRLNSLV